MCLILESLEAPGSGDPGRVGMGQGLGGWGHPLEETRGEKLDEELWKGRPGEGSDWPVKTLKHNNKKICDW